MKQILSLILCLLLQTTLAQQIINMVTPETKIQFQNNAEVTFSETSNPVGTDSIDYKLLEAKNSLMGIRINDDILASSSNVLVGIYVNVTDLSNIGKDARINITLRPRDKDNKVLESGASTTAVLTNQMMLQGRSRSRENAGMDTSITAGNPVEINGETWAYILARFNNLPQAINAADFLVRVVKPDQVGTIHFAGWTILRY